MRITDNHILDMIIWHEATLPYEEKEDQESLDEHDGSEILQESGK